VNADKKLFVGEGDENPLVGRSVCESKMHWRKRTMVEKIMLGVVCSLLLRYDY